MTKINDLQQKLISLLQEEQEAYLAYKKLGNQDRSKLKRYERKIKQLHQAIKEIVELEKREIKQNTNPQLWNDPLVQNYFGMYAQQKGPYVINDINLINENEISISAATTEIFRHHKSLYHNAKEDYILLRLQERGILRYYERLFVTPEKHTEVVAERKSILNMKDTFKNNYLIELLKEKNRIFLTARSQIHQGGTRLLAEEFAMENNLDEKMDSICALANKYCPPSTNKLDQTYFNDILDSSKDINILKEIPGPKRIRKNPFE